MSHTVKVTTQWRSREMLAAACKALDVVYNDNQQQQVNLFSGTVKCDFSANLHEWRYPIAVNTQTGDVKYDNYNGSWGSERELDRLNQEYALQVAENHPSIQEKLAEGWQSERVQLENGKQRLRIYEPVSTF